MRFAIYKFAALVFGILISNALAQDVYVRIPLDQLTRTEGKFPATTAPTTTLQWEQQAEMHAYAVLDTPGEIFLSPEVANVPGPTVVTPGLPSAVCVHATGPGDITGRLFVPRGDGSGMVLIKFKISPADAKSGDRREFYTAKQDYYDRLADSGVAGSAWFRHEAREAAKELGSNVPTNPSDWRQFRQAPGELDDTYSLFSGGRAVSENLQLDRVVPAGRSQGKADETVDVKSIDGISAQAMDWGPLIKNLSPATDPLATLIPADQHGVFFPSFDALTATLDESDRDGTIALHQIEPRTEDARTRQRYERHLGVSLTALARALGPELVGSVAITGSDPYLRVGSDLTMLFQTRNAAALKGLLIAQITASCASNPAVKTVTGNAGSISWNGWESADATIRSYVGQVGDAVVLTDSLQQLDRVDAVNAGREQSLAKQPEYIFFRDRYRLGDDDETALIVLSDATIRRWCGPRWRIGDSRRTRAAAVLSELQARWLDPLARGNVKPGPIYTDLSVPELGDLMLTQQGVTSSTYGSLEMMTPIAQLPLDKVTPAEADAYNRWRSGYETNWRWFFDPIAVRLGIHQKKLSADVTVLPLIWGSDYREMVDLTRGVKLASDAGDPHDSLWHVIISINKDSPTFKQGANFASNLAPGLSVDPLSWLGPSVGLYVDDDPIWQEMAKATDESQFLEDNFARLPIALRADVSSGRKLTAFLVSLRAFVDQTSPGMTVWENLTYNGVPYVKISPSETTKGQDKRLENAAIYYAASGDSFLITLNEPLLKRALDRQVARTQPTSAATKPSAIDPWLGENVALRASVRLLSLMMAGSHEQNQFQMQLRAWSNLPVLNEWKRRYPDQDPIKLHDAVWGSLLVDPGGGKYVWNEEWQTMESTDYGSPGEPKDGPTAASFLQGLISGSFGLTFEDQGLRGRMRIERGPVGAK